MKLNICLKSLLLTFGITKNFVAGATITKPVVPWKEQCWGPDMEFKEQSLCGDKDGYTIHAYLKEFDCGLKFACFLNPNDSTENSIKAKNSSECIKMGGEYYCSADPSLSNIDCPDCTFPEFIQKVSLTIGSFFKYDFVDENDQFDYQIDQPNPTESIPVPMITTTTTTTDNVPTSTSNVVVPWKDQCAGPAMEFKEQSLCGDKDGYTIHAYLEEFDCDLKFACFLKPDDSTENSVKAQNSSECIKIRGEYYCSADPSLSNIDCPDCTFPEFVKNVSLTIGRFFKYDNINENDQFDYQIDQPKSTETISTTETIPTTIPTNCEPVTVTIKEPTTVTLKETITVKEILTVTVQSASATNIPDIEENCAAKYGQCGGEGFSGPNCCKSGLTCKSYNKYFSQCL